MLVGLMLNVEPGARPEVGRIGIVSPPGAVKDDMLGWTERLGRATGPATGAPFAAADGWPTGAAADVPPVANPATPPPRRNGCVGTPPRPPWPLPNPETGAGEALAAGENAFCAGGWLALCAACAMPG